MRTFSSARFCASATPAICAFSPSNASHSSHAVFSASALMRRCVLSSICRCRASAVAASVFLLKCCRSWSLFSLHSNFDVSENMCSLWRLCF